MIEFFLKRPEAFPLYEAVRAKICELPGVTVKVSKTQVSFSNRHGFAYVSLPHSRIKGHPAACILVTFGLSYRLDDPRIYVATEPYPMRWTHHVIVERVDEVDDQLMAWIREAYHFSAAK